MIYSPIKYDNTHDVKLCVCSSKVASKDVTVYFWTINAVSGKPKSITANEVYLNSDFGSKGKSKWVADLSWSVVEVLQIWIKKIGRFSL